MMGDQQTKMCEEDNCQITPEKLEKKKGNLEFLTDMGTALKKAQELNRIIMIDFYTDWCGWCTELDEKTYSDPGVEKLLSQFVNVKIDAENEEGPELVEKYGVHGYPAIIFVDSHGDPVDILEGFYPPERFLPELERILKDEDTLSGLQKKLSETPDDLSLLLKVIEKKNDFGMKEECLNDCRQVIEKGNKESDRESIIQAYELMIQYSESEAAIGFNQEMLKAYPELDKNKKLFIGEKYYDYGVEKLVVVSFKLLNFDYNRQ